jgi:hypothetical protein
MAAWGGSRASEAALRWRHPTGLWRLENGSSTGTADVVEYGLWARRAWPSVAELSTGVLTALELAATYLEADVLRFIVLVGSPLVLPPLGCRLLARAAVLSTLVPPAVEVGFANAEAMRMRDVALMTQGLGRYPTASARYIGNPGARCARAGVAFA